MFPPKRLACWARVRPALTVLVTLAVVGALVAALNGKSHSFTAALHTAPLGLLGVAAALQLLALLARTEAWNVSVRATGATVGRRCLYRAASVGSVASVANGQLCVAARIAVLRRLFDPAGDPRPALLGAEGPILATEAILAALTSFTLVGPLGLPWWVPLLCVAATVWVAAGLCALAGNRRRGLCAGLGRAAQPRRALAGGGPGVDRRPRADRAQLPHPALHRRRGVRLRLHCGAHRDGDHRPTAPRAERRSGGDRADPRRPRGSDGGGGRGAATATGTASGLLRRLGSGGLAGARATEGPAERRSRERGATERAYLRRPPQADLARAIHLPLAFATRPRPWPAPAFA